MIQLQMMSDYSGMRVSQWEGWRCLGRSSFRKRQTILRLRRDLAILASVSRCLQLRFQSCLPRSYQQAFSSQSQSSSFSALDITHDCSLMSVSFIDFTWQSSRYSLSRFSYIILDSRLQSFSFLRILRSRSLISDCWYYKPSQPMSMDLPLFFLKEAIWCFSSPILEIFQAQLNSQHFLSRSSRPFSLTFNFQYRSLALSSSLSFSYFINWSL